MKIFHFVKTWSRWNHIFCYLNGRLTQARTRKHLLALNLSKLFQITFFFWYITFSDNFDGASQLVFIVLKRILSYMMQIQTRTLTYLCVYVYDSSISIWNKSLVSCCLNKLVALYMHAMMRRWSWGKALSLCAKLWIIFV